jgi:hypothetical protein
MTLRYKPAFVKGATHYLEIDGEKFESTREKEVRNWAKTRIYSRYIWKQLKESIRLGESLTVDGGGLFDKD